MSKIIALGSTLKIASTYATAKAVSAISNANPAVATLEVSHGVIVGDKIQLQVAWEGLNNLVCRVSAVSTNDVTLEGVDTSDTDVFPPGGGVGTVREITAWTEITQLTRDIAPSGGEPQFADVSTLKNTRDQRLPVSESAVDLTVPVFHDPSLAWYGTVRSAKNVPTAGEIVYPNGAGRELFSGYWFLGKANTINDRTFRKAVAIAYEADPVEYAN